MISGSITAIRHIAGPPDGYPYFEITLEIGQPYRPCAPDWQTQENAKKDRAKGMDAEGSYDIRQEEEYKKRLQAWAVAMAEIYKLRLGHVDLSQPDYPPEAQILVPA